LSDNNLTDQELTNLRRTDEWAVEWSIPAGSSEKLVNELYADQTEIRGVLQSTKPMIKAGDGKDKLMAFEKAGASGMKSRSMRFIKKIAQGDTVAIQVEVDYVTSGGRAGVESFAAFLTFDDEGRIAIDHTFLRDKPFSER
jgi:hypothetical protein